MILIADSGSTKTDWCVVLNGAVIKRLGTKGINPFFLNCRKGNSMQFTSTEQVVHPRKLPSSDGLLQTVCPLSGILKLIRICWLPPTGYVARRLVSPVFWGRGPILVFTMEKRSSVTSLLSDLFWEMKVAVPYLENCW